MGVFYGVVAGFIAGAICNFFMYKREIAAGTAVYNYAGTLVGYEKATAILHFITTKAQEAVEKL